jgi:hypothetical protein
MLDQIKTKPAFQIHHLALSTDILDNHTALLPSAIQNHANLLQLADGIGVPVAGQWAT